MLSVFDIHVFLLKLTSGTQKDGNLEFSCIEFVFFKFCQAEYISLHMASPISLCIISSLKYKNTFWKFSNFKITLCKLITSSALCLFIQNCQQRSSFNECYWRHIVNSWKEKRSFVRMHWLLLYSSHAKPQ